ncbi:MAG TPA: hypothetical protein VFH68_19775 [Polyangia bacterium]|nr:hypothetical protein [Polyangia bacterium]
MRFAQLSDWLSPILVKELRQGRRSRALILLAVLTLLASGMITLYAIGKDSGTDAFIALYFCLSIVGFLIVPLTAHRSFVREQEDGSWQVLQLTGLGPRRILAGKLASSLAQVAILSVAVSPFLILSHFLTGYGLLNIALLCAAGALMTGALTPAALFAATLPTTRAQRGVLQILVLVGLICGLSACVSFAMEVGRRGVDTYNLVASLWGVVSVGFVLFEAAAARISLPTENYAWRPRLALIVLLIGVTALGVWAHVRVWGFGVPGPIFPDFVDYSARNFHLLTVLIISAGALAMATEADRAGPPGHRRFSLFAPGALAGFRLTVLLLVASTAFWGAVAEPHWLPGMVVVASYPILYLAAALWVCRGLRPRALVAPDATRFVLGSWALLGAFVPWLLGKGFSAHGAAEEFPLALISPAVGYAFFDHPLPRGLYGPWVIGALAVLAGVATDRLLARRRADRA